jgi:hypothetical protein
VTTPSGQNVLTILTKVDDGLEMAPWESQPQTAAVALAPGGDTTAAASSLLVVTSGTTMSALAGTLGMALASSLSCRNALVISTKCEDGLGMALQESQPQGT